MGEKGNAAEAVQTTASGAGSSVVGQAGRATANVVLDTGETLRGKLVEGAAEGASQAATSKLRRKPADGPEAAAGGDGPEPPAPDQA